MPTPVKPDDRPIEPITKKKKPRQYYCACGRRALRRSCGDWACARCIEIEARMNWQSSSAGLSKADYEKTDWYETGLPAQ